MASEKEINQRLRSLHQDFDFLLDNNVISTELYDQLTQQIPRRNDPAHQVLMGRINSQDTTRVQGDPTLLSFPLPRVFRPKFLRLQPHL